MGVDYYTCEECGRNFPDCLDYFGCFSCGSLFCSDECGGKEYLEEPEKGVEEMTTCVLCRKESVTDGDLLSFVLKMHNMTYDQALELYKKEE